MPLRMKSARVAGAIDATARHLERTFRRGSLEPISASRPCSTAAGCRHRRQRRWVGSVANQPMDRLVPRRTRLQAPVVETIRDPDFLAAVKSATEAREVKDRTGHLHHSRSRLRRDRSGLCLMVARWPCCATSPKPSAWKKPVATLSPTFLMNCALPSLPFRVIPKLFSTTPRKMARPTREIYRNHSQECYPHVATHGGLAYVGES